MPPGHKMQRASEGGGKKGLAAASRRDKWRAAAVAAQCARLTKQTKGTPFASYSAARTFESHNVLPQLRK